MWLLRLSLCAFFFLMAARGQAAPRATQQTETMLSSVLGEERRWQVQLPASYAREHDARYPVFFVLDAEERMPVWGALAQHLSSGLFPSVPEAIVVGIENTVRMRDFTATRTLSLPNGDPGQAEYAQTGGAARFLAFLEKELLPAIQSKYRTQGLNLLVGHSLAGLFVLEAAVQGPTGFQGFLALDASLWFDSPRYFNQLIRGLQFLSQRPRVLHLAVSNHPLTPGWGLSFAHRDLNLRLIQLLGRMQPAGLSWSSRYYEQEDHWSVSAPAFLDGLRTVFDGYRIDCTSSEFSVKRVVDNYAALSRRWGVELRPQRYELARLLRFVQARNVPESQEQIVRELLAHYYPSPQE